MRKCYAYLEVISEDMGVKLAKATVDQLGKARKIIATKEHTTIIEGGGDKQKIADRVAQIRKELENSTSEFDKEKLQERLAKLAGGVGVIKVGAFTETEMKTKKFKIEDALNATKAAVAEGIVAGGGAALAKISPLLGTFMQDPKFSEDEKTGMEIVQKALEAPLRQIADNTGVEASAIITYVQTGRGYEGYDFTKYRPGKWEDGKQADMIKAGIVDPLRVTRLALENAVSIASTLLTSEAIIVDKPEPKAAPAGGAGPGMGMDY